ncbi:MULTISPECIES: VOC family protein [Hyphobacterium]|uniref:VOC family protein n=1 Tax=Hyphobacterium vulgare TaxID=1736751 RepID=A0ABV6ZTL1_9PROT
MADLTDIKSAAPQLPVGDLQRSLEFYASQLGFRTIDIWPENAPTEALVSKNDAHLRLVAEPEPRGDPRGEATVTIRVDNPTGLYGLLKNRVEIEESLGWSPDGRRYFAFRDPDGHRIVFIDMN